MRISHACKIDLNPGAPIFASLAAYRGWLEEKRVEFEAQKHIAMAFAPSILPDLGCHLVELGLKCDCYPVSFILKLDEPFAMGYVTAEEVYQWYEPAVTREGATVPEAEHPLSLVLWWLARETGREVGVRLNHDLRTAEVNCWFSEDLREPMEYYKRMFTRLGRFLSQFYG